MCHYCLESLFLVIDPAFALDFSFYIARLISKVFASPLNNQTAHNPLK
jgi:hypothetical protein